MYYIAYESDHIVILSTIEVSIDTSNDNIQEVPSNSYNMNVLQILLTW
jgi:hypothetical protein